MPGAVGTGTSPILPTVRVDGHAQTPLVLRCTCERSGREDAALVAHDLLQKGACYSSESAS